MNAAPSGSIALSAGSQSENVGGSIHDFCLPPGTSGSEQSLGSLKENGNIRLMILVADGADGRGHRTTERETKRTGSCPTVVTSPVS